MRLNVIWDPTGSTYKIEFSVIINREADVDNTKLGLENSLSRAKI